METINPDLLNQIAVFIATHGLAVFLVVYYAVWMYPQLREERKDWIEQITRLRQLVDPETRPLTNRQAEVAFELAVNAYIDKLKLQFNRVTLAGFGTLAPGQNIDKDSKMTQTNAFGELVEYMPNLKNEEASKDFKLLINRIQSLRKIKERMLRDALLRLFREVNQSAQSITHQLGKLHFGLGTLEGPWRETQEEIKNLWEATSKNGFSYFREEDLDKLKQFLQKHPGLEIMSESEIESMQDVLKLGEIKTEDLIELTRGVLQQSLNNLIESSSEYHQ